MVSDLWHIPLPASGRLAILARPRGGDWLPDEVEGWRRAGVEIVVSLLEPAEVLELDIADEPDCCAGVGLRFVAHPIPDRGVPADRVQFNKLIGELVEAITVGRHVGVHCRAGIGRSGLVAAGVLARLGLTAAEAFRTVAAARDREVPDTPEQAAWLCMAD